jgi:hypothetical protein
MTTIMNVPQRGADASKITVADMRSRWGKFSEAELAGIRHRATLVQGIQDKYGLSKERADQDVQAWAKGRVF